MESKHTLHYNQGSIKADNGQTVAYMNREAGTTPLSPVKRDDMAKLFAAAPELLEACKEALIFRRQKHHGDDKLIALLEKVINKATI